MNEKEFFDWLVKSGKQANSANTAVSRVKRIEEVYPDLDSRIEDNSIEILQNTFIYTKKDEAKNRVPLHKIAIDGNPYTGTQSLRTALAQYIEFKRTAKCHMAAQNSSKTITSESASPLSKASESIYKIDDFRVWLIECGGLKETSAGSYVSYLKALERSMMKKSEGLSVLEIAYRALSDDNTALAFEILEEVDEKLTTLLSSSSVSSEMKKDLNNWRSAIRKYVDFLQDYLEDIPDEEELEEANTHIPTVEVVDGDMEDLDNSEKIAYSIEELKKNFAFRLSTQNRMSKDKDIYYPISIIRKLFCYSQRNGKKASAPNSDYDWFKNWVDDYAGDIKVILSGESDKSYPLSGVRSLIMYPATDNIYVQLSNTNGDIRVYTQTHDGKTEPMKATSLRNIHIDHTPLMAKVLSDNIPSIPAIDALSKTIKTVARDKRIDIKPKNFGKISKVLFADSEYVISNLLPLIPALKDELNLLRNKCTLSLMQASHNLRKK